MRKYFTYYLSYYLVSKNLDDKRYLRFNKALLKVQFSHLNTLECALSINFNDKILDNAWVTVITQLSKRDRSCEGYSKWRNDVYKRDRYTCQICSSKKKINAHHIVRWVDSIELRFDLSNGVTLCENCHKLIHKGEIKL